MCSAFLIRTSTCIPVSVSCIKMLFIDFVFLDSSVFVSLSLKTWVTAAAAPCLLPPSGERASLRAGEEEAAGIVPVIPPDGPHSHTHRRCGETRHRSPYFVWEYDDRIVRTKVGGNKRRLQWQQQQVESPFVFFVFCFFYIPNLVIQQRVWSEHGSSLWPAWGPSCRFTVGPESAWGSGPLQCWKKSVFNRKLHQRRGSSHHDGPQEAGRWPSTLMLRPGTFMWTGLCRNICFATLKLWNFHSKIQIREQNPE